MNWQIALLLFFITAVAQALLQRSYSQSSKLPESFPPAISYLLGVTPIGIIVGLSISHSIHWSVWLVCLLIIEGIFIGLYNWLSFKSIRQLPIARYQTIYQSYEIIVILLGWVLLGEKLNAYQLFGGALLMCSALIAVRAPIKNQSSFRKHVDRKAVVLAILAAITMGIGLIAEKASLHYMDIGAYFIFGYLTQTIALLVLAAKDVTKSNLKAIKPYDVKRMLAMGTLSAFIGFFYIIAITKSNNISLITALSAFTLPLVVLASYLILRERENAKLLWLATILGFIGLLITALH